MDVGEVDSGEGIDVGVVARWMETLEGVEVTRAAVVCVEVKRKVVGVVRRGEIGVVGVGMGGAGRGGVPAVSPLKGREEGWTENEEDKTVDDKDCKVVGEEGE